MAESPQDGLNQGHVLRRTLNPSAVGLTLLEVVQLLFDHGDAGTWQARFSRGEVLLNGAQVAPDTLVEPGMKLSWAKPPWREPAAPLHFDVLYDDAWLLAVAKPSGLPTLPGAGFQEHTLLALVREHAPGASPMHRLGRGTSGVVLFAKTSEAASGVQHQWRTPGSIGKTYRALVVGEPSDDRFTVNTPIGLVPDPVLGELFCATSGGKPSCSHFRVLERRGEASLVDVDIETGRPHQIRIHAAMAGHPLVGDPLYGPGGRRARGSEARPGDLGYLLHAHVLTLAHPVSEARLEVVAPPPETLRLDGR